MVLPTLSAFMLGSYEVFYGETALIGRLRPSPQILLAYLLLHRDTPLTRQQLAFHFWPDSTDAQARANLRKSLYRLRQDFPEIDHYLDWQGATLSWHAGIPLQLDVADFEARLDQAAVDPAQQAPFLNQALALYKGDLLPDIYDDWVLAAREQLRSRYLQALQTLAALYEQQRDYQAAIPLVRQLLREDPLVEETYRHLMRLQALNGDVPGALRTYHRCARQLEQELGVAPAEATQQAYHRLLDRREATPAAPASRPVPLVGRDDVWQQLLQVWRQVAAGRSQAVLISGEAGIGKTRLAEELLRWTGRQGIPALPAACFPLPAQLPLAPVADWLRAEPAARALPALPPRWQSELVRLLPELLAGDSALEMPPPLTEAWQQQHFFMALVEAVVAAGEPLLLFLDDLHWADADTLSWLHFLARQKREHHFLLLATLRSEEVGRRHPLPAWQEGLARVLPLHQIRLDPLDAPATAALASRIRGSTLDEAAAAALYGETEGNPLFTVEMVRAGFPLTPVSLPQKVRSIIELRLDRLTPPARELATLAAVLGRRFAVPLLQAASPWDQAELLDSLDELWRRQLIREQGEDAYDFTHGKIREGAIARLSPTRRRWWHQRVAEALAKVYAGELDGMHGEIAAHWEAANHPHKAADHFLQAAQCAARLYAHDETLQYLQRALTLLPAGHPKCFHVHSQLGEALLILGQYANAAAAFQKAATLAEDTRNSARLLSRHVLALSGGGEYKQAEGAYQDAIALLEATPAADRDEATWRIWLDLHLSLLDALYFANKSDEMQEICQTMAKPLEVHGSARQRANYFAYLSRTRLRIMRYKVTNEEVAERQTALQWARQTDDENLICEHQFGLGFTLLWAGRVAEAAGMLHQASAQAEALGNIPLQSRCLIYLGIAYRMQGDEARVRKTLKKLAPVVRIVGHRNYLGIAEALRGWLAWQSGDKLAAHAHCQTAVDMWGPPESSYPIQWLARFLSLSMNVEATRAGEVAVDAQAVASAQADARAMLAPIQQRLPEALTAALEAAVAADNAYTIVAHLQEACRLAREHGFL